MDATGIISMHQLSSRLHFSSVSLRNTSSIQGHDRAQQQLLEADGCFFVAVGTFPRFPLDQVQADVLFLFVESIAEKNMLNHSSIGFD